MCAVDKGHYPAGSAAQLRCYLQGTADDVIDVSHGKKLVELSKRAYEPLFIEGGTHCDLEFFSEYINHLRKFIRHLEEDR